MLSTVDPRGGQRQPSLPGCAPPTRTFVGRGLSGECKWNARRAARQPHLTVALAAFGLDTSAVYHPARWLGTPPPPLRPCTHPKARVRKKSGPAARGPARTFSGHSVAAARGRAERTRWRGAKARRLAGPALLRCCASAAASLGVQGGSGKGPEKVRRKSGESPTKVRRKSGESPTKVRARTFVGPRSANVRGRSGPGLAPPARTFSGRGLSGECKA